MVPGQDRGQGQRDGVDAATRVPRGGLGGASAGLRLGEEQEQPVSGLVKVQHRAPAPKASRAHSELETP